MRKLIPLFGSLTLVALGATAFSFGGWAVITVDDLPEFLAVGQPDTIAFAVRQHGMRLLEGLRPTLVASDAKHQTGDVSAAAVPSGPAGHYVATLLVPSSGDWIVTINSGFVSSHLTLDPIPAGTTRTGRPRPDAPADVGRRLFIAKGCVTCHVHDAVSGNSSMNSSNYSLAIGPNLTPRRYEAAYLGKLLADPSVARSTGQQFTMPKLGLKTTEISALVAFINAERQVSTR